MHTYNVRRMVNPGNCKSLWQAVNMAKDLGTNTLQNEMLNEGSVTYFQILIIED